MLFQSFLLTTYSQNYERRAGKRFFLSIYDVTSNLRWICSCCKIMMKFFQNSFKMSHFRIICVSIDSCAVGILNFFFRFREKQIMCRNICSHLTIFPLTHLITSFNQESRKNLTDSKPKFQKTFLIRTLWNRDYKMFLQKPLDGFVKALKQLFFFSKTFFQVLTVFKSDIWLDILMKIFFLVSLFTIKIEFWSSKRFGM